MVFSASLPIYPDKTWSWSRGRRKLAGPLGLGLPCVWDPANLALRLRSSPVYLSNDVALALHLEGYPDPSLDVVQAAVAGTGYTGYVSPDYVAPEPEAPAEPAPRRKR
jgi:hypothetical protein